MRVGICGLGTVGSGLFGLFQNNLKEINRKLEPNVALVQVGCRRDHPDCDLSTVQVTRDIFEVARNPEVDILIEVIGGTDVAKDLVLEAIANGKHVVTANKALIALHGDEVFRAAEEKGVQVRFEAAIAGGIPIVKAVREGLAGNRIEWVVGILNGTSNFILTEMAREGSNASFADVLSEAQALGYAEADPTFDVEGIDAAHKLTILASIAFGIGLSFEAMYMEGITKITVPDIRFAKELGYRIKHLGIAQRFLNDDVELRVHPCLVPVEHLLAQVNGVMNGVMVGSDAAGSTLYCGAGAGAGPTASAVMADIVDVIRGGSVPNLGFTHIELNTHIRSIKQISSSYYLRLAVEDKVGVMANVAAILSRHGISIEALIQKDAKKTAAQIVIVTNEVSESNVNAAIAQLVELPEVLSDIGRIRIAAF